MGVPAQKLLLYEYTQNQYCGAGNKDDDAKVVPVPADIIVPPNTKDPTVYVVPFAGPEGWALVKVLTTRYPDAAGDAAVNVPPIVEVDGVKRSAVPCPVGVEGF